MNGCKIVEAEGESGVVEVVWVSSVGRCKGRGGRKLGGEIGCKL